MKNKVYLFDRAMRWIKANTIDGNGITVSTKERVLYPEVTGYYIPTLLQWGERNLALSYARHLCAIQKEDGSWYDSRDHAPYVFDTAQILKGLIAVRDILPEVDEHIVRGCDWMLSRVSQEGRLVTPAKDAWGNDEAFCSELIHTYCLTPLVDAARIFEKGIYREAAFKVKEYYVANYRDRILHFSLLSHFYAYVMEGLLDLEEEELVRQAMHNMEKHQKPNGGIPGLNNVTWCCSTGMFQLALVWYRLGELDRGNRTFDYACRLQNASGGWFGSYPCSIPGHLPDNRITRSIPFLRRRVPCYFRDAEISWANKYFLDALFWRLKLDFERQAPTFLGDIDREDGRYRLIRRYASAMEPGGADICDIGCGKGRYLKNLMRDCPGNRYYAADISERVMSGIRGLTEKRMGSLTDIPYEDGRFDMVYVCEALEHAVSVEAAARELLRVTKRSGVLVTIDKPVEKLGALKIDAWERWIDDGQMRDIAGKEGRKLKIINSVPYEGRDDGLFRAWIFERG